MSTTRTITQRVMGERHGPITRLISPSDLGEELKPFIFLDFFSARIQPGFGFAMHPHSGIATLTWQPGSDVQYEDTRGAKELRQFREENLSIRLRFRADRGLRQR